MFEEISFSLQSGAQSEFKQQTPIDPTRYEFNSKTQLDLIRFNVIEYIRIGEEKQM